MRSFTIFTKNDYSSLSIYIPLLWINLLICHNKQDLSLLNKSVQITNKGEEQADLVRDEFRNQQQRQQSYKDTTSTQQ